jgi:hypothetical protein
MATYDGFICKECGYKDGWVKQYTGTFALELSAWLVSLLLAAFISIIMLIPPLFYTIFRATTAKKVCGMCLSTNRIPANSPAGQHLRESLHPIGTKKP